MTDYYGGRTMYSNTDERYDVGRNGSTRMYSHTDGYYGDVDRTRPGAYADDCYDARQTAVYSDDYSRGGGYGGGEQQQFYKREEKEHKHRERLGEVGALAGGAFALVSNLLSISSCQTISWNIIRS